jgi:uncharacterized protein (UPF0264 family)
LFDPNGPPGLLVSVRSAGEALEALAGGASVIDLKEPARGPLGPTDASVWAAVRSVLPPSTILSVALGEAIDWLADPPPIPPPYPADWAGLRFRKLGLSGLADREDWFEMYQAARRRIGEGPGWVAVAYADHEAAGAPPISVVLEAAAGDAETVGLLVDTWDKLGPGLESHAADLAPLIADARRRGLVVALAGRLTPDSLRRLAPLAPALFGVRGAVCEGGRGGTVDRAKVAVLVSSLSRGEALDTPRTATRV